MKKKICFIVMLIVALSILILVLSIIRHAHNSAGTYYDAPEETYDNYTAEKEESDETEAEDSTEDVRSSNTNQDDESTEEKVASEEEITEETEDDIRYKFFTSDLMTNFLNGTSLASTGNEEMDAFLQRFYDKALNSDTYVQDFLDMAESYGVDTSVIDELIDINADRRIGVWIDGISDKISEKSEEEKEE